MKNRIVVPATELKEFVKSIFIRADVPEEHAAIVADCLVTANLSGVDSHGIVRLAHYISRLENGTIKPCPNLAFQKTAPSLGILNGDDGLGHVVIYHACEHAMKLAEESGTGAVSVKNSSHPGMLGFYLMNIISAGYSGLITAATDPFLIPFGARKPFFGTNPIAFGFPTHGIPVILDMATTSIPYGKVALAKAEGKSIPSDWGFNEEGNPTNDPHKIVGLHPIAGAKGSGLAMIIDIFSSILSGMPCGPHINKMYIEMGQPRKLGHFIWILDIKKLMPIEFFKQRLGDMLSEFGELRPAEGFNHIYYPGQIEGERRQERAKDGIPIDPGLYRELQGLAEKFDISLPGSEGGLHV
ncbi:Ldh family oxidoreductase [Planctomycetota bacterium]